MSIIVGMNEITLLVTIRVTLASLLILLNADLEMYPYSRIILFFQIACVVPPPNGRFYFRKILIYYP
jgi:hypothetical protein